MQNRLFLSFRLILTLLGFSLFGVVYATINYFELFPNGSSLYQSQSNGWVTTTASTSKEIMTPQGCKKVTAGATTKRYFIPTRTLTEWNSFRNNPPGGASITECPINGVCSWSANTCSVGTPSGYNPGSCGGSQTWTCLGQYGGTNASCSIANAPCPTPINGLCNNAYAGFSPGVPCFAGISSSYNGGSCGGNATWMCLGQNGGTNDSCNHTNPPCSTPVNGVCGGSANTCNAGTAGGYNAGSCGGSQTWTCYGQNGGTNASCSIANPACVSVSLLAGSYLFDAFYPANSSATYSVPSSFQTSGNYTINYYTNGAYDDIGCSRAGVRITVLNSSNIIIGDGGWVRPTGCGNFEFKSFSFNGTPSTVYIESRFEGIEGSQWHGHVWAKDIVLIKN